MNRFDFDQVTVAAANAPWGLLPWLFIGMGGIIAVTLLTAILFRVVVPTNEVHIVQSGKSTTSYGKDQPSGNTYYQWPAWLPRIGVRVIDLPMSVFSINLNDYPAYDKGRVPFTIDVMAFFRISDSNKAAQRVETTKELHAQLIGIMQGAIRSILAGSEIEEILEFRATFGEKFTTAVDQQLEEWGVKNVKNIELMDIRDREGSKVIDNIMAKKKSLIERESRIQVAENHRAALEAEIVAKREVSLRDEEAKQQVGQREAEREKQVGISKQRAIQEVREEEKETMTRTKAVQEIDRVRSAEIERKGQVILAEQEQLTLVIKSEAAAQQVRIAATAALEQSKLNAQGVEVEGKAEGEAKKAVLMAPVAAQLTLAEKIASLKEYQVYLLTVEQIKANQVVGVAQADALRAAGIKVIANGGTITDGVSSISDLLSSKGGQSVAAMIEGFSQTEIGKSIMKKVS